MKTNKIALTVLLLSMIALIFSGCGGGNPIIPPVDEEIEPIIPETTKVVEEETIEEIVSVTEDQSTIVFDKSTPQLEELTLGDIIVMGVTENTPEGLLRKVTNITKGGKDGSQVIIETEFASLEEAIEQGSFEFDITLEPEDIEKGISYPKGVRLIEDKFETGYSFYYELDKVLCNNHLIVDGELSFDYHILLNGTIGFFKLKTLEFKNTVKSKVELDVTLTDSFSVGDLLDDNPKTVFTILFDTITVWIGVAPVIVPVTLTPQIDINVGLDGEIFAELTTGVTIFQEDEGAYVAGVEFDNGTWKEIKDEPVFTFEYREPTLSADAKIKAYAGPQLELMLYGIAGPHCNIYGYLDFEADIWDDPWWELYAGLDVTAGLQLEIITKFWSAVYSSPEFDIINYRTPEPIARADGPFISLNHDPVISNLTAASSSININETTTITCIASDQDGNTLTYSWSKTGGTIIGSGSTITWTAPSTAGTYTITCTVSDGRGGQDSGAISIVVIEKAIYVPDDYSKIQSAIYSASDGDRIIVRDGIYYENISVDRGVIICSENGPDNCIVSATDYHVFSVYTDNVSISGLTMEREDWANYAGIYIGENIKNSYIYNNICKNNGTGIYLANSANSNKILNNTCSDTGVGIYLSSQSNNNIIENNTCLNNSQGIILASEAYNNVIKGNACLVENSYWYYYHSGNGIVLNSSADNNTIQNNSCIGNSYGIFLNSASNNIIINNTCSDHLNCGIKLDYPSCNNTVQENICSDNCIGISLDYSYGFFYGPAESTNYIKGNTCSNNWRDGISVSFLSNNIIESNICADNGDGITLGSAPSNTVKDNNCSNNDQGISLYSSDSNTVKDNNCSNNDRGINLYSSDNNLLRYNTCTDNRNGIYIDGGNNNTIQENSFFNNSCGIYLYSSSNYNYIKGNTCSNNEKGIHLSSKSGYDYGCIGNYVYLNNFIDNTIYSCKSNENNNFYSPNKITYTYNNSNYTNYLGNYYSDFLGSDDDGDGIHERPYHIGVIVDDYPLINLKDNYQIDDY